MTTPDPNLIGRGGFGKNKGLSVQEIEDRFATCRADPSMRSVSAILRITREQLEARGQLGIYPKLSAAAVVVAVILFAAQPVLPEALRKMTMPAAIGAAVLAAPLLYGALSTHRERQAALAQEREIKRLATESLASVLSTEFTRKPLTREQTDTLRDLVKQEPTASGLKDLLEPG